MRDPTDTLMQVGRWSKMMGILPDLIDKFSSGFVAVESLDLYSNAALQALGGTASASNINPSTLDLVHLH